jgi:hypothetical protein
MSKTPNTEYGKALAKAGIKYQEVKLESKSDRQDLEGLPVVTTKSFNQAVTGMLAIDEELAAEGFTAHRLGDAPEIRISIGPKCLPLSMKARQVGSSGGHGGSCINLSAELNLTGELLQEWIALRDKIIASGQGWE